MVYSTMTTIYCTSTLARLAKVIIDDLEQGFVLDF